MSAFCRMYAPCLWKPVCDTEKPVSCSSAAHSRRCAAAGSGVRTAPAVQRHRHRGDPLRVLAVDPVADEELLDGRGALVALHGPPEQIVEHAEAQRAADRIDALDAELRRPRPP